MATKCIVLGQPEQEKKGKPIEFIKAMGIEGYADSSTNPCVYKNIELVAKKYSCNLDLMFAYGSCRSSGMCYLGHWNDGYVE